MKPISRRDWCQAVGAEIANNTCLLAQLQEPDRLIVGTPDDIWRLELSERSDEISSRLGGIAVAFVSVRVIAETWIAIAADHPIPPDLKRDVADVLWGNSGFYQDVMYHLARLVALKEMPYRDYLTTDHWQATRAHAVDASDGRCALDSRHKAENVHHRTYERRGRERLDDLIVLCKSCHSKFHDKVPS